MGGILALTPALQGCATGPSFHAPIELASSRDVTIVRASGRFKKDGLWVAGDVRRTNGYGGVVPGHLRISAYSSSGVAAENTSHWGEFKNRRLRLAYFNAFLPIQDFRQISSIHIKVED